MRTLKAGTGRIIEKLLPKASAEASCWNECWNERNSATGQCRTCCMKATGGCRITCSSWAAC
ncbi:hypothetical protein [Yinghuangia soli]|uniref:Uncharacterized protein n=1 Tax=Yinghuangia soli TaxID=2908204 RepID=A0AA41PVC8_9ACTN|nr:hypothetical protein [Yinghuangia soli]MCF2526040.1 hypothetical protein [Yinghuangia soli]